MKEKLMQLIVEMTEKYGDVLVFFDYNKEYDTYNHVIAFNNGMRITTIFENLMKLPNKIKSFEQYFAVGRIEYVLE